MTSQDLAAGHTVYRADIDGLRAVAVLSVVAFHVGLVTFGGGFVGVDVFFVISGYLITQILLREVGSTGKVRVGAFYARRVRRLFPALAVVVLTTLAAGRLFLLPVGEQPDLARSAYAAAGYVSNLHFENRANDYFAGPSEELPLLHLWSLAVEEQYYLGWPALVLGMWWLAGRLKMDQRRALFGAVALLTIASFALCVVLTARAPGIAFYYLPTRAWELGVGSLLAIGLDRLTIRSDRLGDVLTGAGLLAVFAAVTLGDATMPFPGAIAALPVLGTAFCIAGGASGSGLAGRVLGNRPMVWVGRLSYSLYLWHWPMLAIARTRVMGEKNIARDLLLALASVALAWATLVWIEDPVRYRKPGPFARQGMTLVAGVAISVAIALGGYALSRGANGQSEEPAYAELLAVSIEKPLLGQNCQRQGVPLIDRVECTMQGFDLANEFVVWGDSHSVRAVSAVAGFASTSGIPVVQRSNAACPPLLGVVPSSSSRRPYTTCTQFNDAVLAELEAEVSQGKKIVAVLVARWPNYLGNTAPSGVRGRILFDTTGDAESFEIAAIFEDGLERTIAELDALGIRSIIVAPMPEFRHSPPKCRVRFPGAPCAITRFEAEIFSAPANDVIKRVAARYPTSVRVVDAFDAFCDTETCRPVLNGRLAYADEHHLTHTAGAALVPEFSLALGWAAEPQVMADRRDLDAQVP